MNIESAKVEWFLKGRAFSILLCLLCCFFAFRRVTLLIKEFSLFESGHLLFNITLAILFITRTRASVVSMNPVHWFVAPTTSFSGFFFIRGHLDPRHGFVLVSNVLVCCATALEGAAVLTLGRSFGFLPALRRLKTGFIYRIVRHPMYLGCIMVRLAYCFRNPLLYNLVLLALIMVLYAIRTTHEEEILSHDDMYADYKGRVKYRLIPGVF